MSDYDSRYEVSTIRRIPNIYHAHFLSVEVGGGSSITAAVSTGRNTISKAMVRLSAPSGIEFKTTKISVEGDGKSIYRECLRASHHRIEEVSFEVIDEAIVLFDLRPDTIVSITVPHTDASSFHAMVCNYLK
jgi:trafficking protein particle complex subunit 10